MSVKLQARPWSSANGWPGGCAPWCWAGKLERSAVLGVRSTLLLDLPLGTHRIQGGVYVAGGRQGALWSSEYLVRVRRVRYTQSQLLAGAESRLPDDWDSPPGGACRVSAQCRTLQGWAAAAQGAALSDFFLTSYTLLGHRLWGYHMPWRGDHRWDRGASNPHARFRMHYTPWKDRIFLGIAAEKFSDEVVKKLEEQREGAKARWKVRMSGSKPTGQMWEFEHAFGNTIGAAPGQLPSFD